MDIPKEATDFAAFWAGLVSDGRVADVVSLYDAEATLMPTFSPHSLRTRDEITDYFTQLAAREGLEVELHEETFAAAELSDGLFGLSGIYSFHFEVDGTSLTFPARFTFVIDLQRDAPILHHHSSQIPRTLS